MISPQIWHDYGLSMVNKIEDLKGFLRVKEEKHLHEQLKNFKNYPVLVFIDTSSNSSAQNADTYREINSALVFILDEAISPQKATPEKELEIDNRMAMIAEEFKTILRSKKDGSGNPCSFLRQLNLNAIHQDPVYNYLGMSGYSIDFEF